MNGVGWLDVLINFFYEWKIAAAILSVVVLCTAGIFALGRMRMLGIGLIIGGIVLGGVFMNIERFVTISQNTTNNYQQPAPNRDNPFNRG
ncbi:MAG: hypothetical protein AB7G47_20030 [Mycolicibacterium sp.]|uniref:hypothetical protein n=1 Tax=Mycolicibacterium sp. TaxID=2320850 RepID=UPI003D142A26